MNLFNKPLCLALSLAAFTGYAAADDLVGTTAKGKGGMHSVGLDLFTGGESVGFEFVVALPKGATNVDVSACMKSLPSTHTSHCVYNEKSNEVIAIAFSPSNDRLQSGALNLGTVRYKTLQKDGGEATIRGLVVADGKGSTIPSEIRTEDAMLGK